MGSGARKPGLEVIKLEYRLKLKIKGDDWLLVDKQPIIALYFEFEFENELKFYNLEACIQGFRQSEIQISLLNYGD